MPPLVAADPARRVRWALVALTLAAPAAGVAIGQMQSAAEHESIAYSATMPADAVAQLQKKIDSGEVTLTFDPAHGYLSSVLENLKVPVSSQGLVFSRTSLQTDRITPWTPRAVYFNDDVYVGWVQGGPIMEVATVDPKLGAVFYSLEQQPSGTPKFERQTHTCLQCHDSSATGGVPGFIVRSVLADRYGYSVSSIGDDVTTDRTPLADRWGGWYVTGTSGEQTHVGNVMAPVLAHEIGNVKNYLARNPLPSGANVTDLAGRFSSKPYLSKDSDIVALLVLTHQSFVHNLITNANYETRKALFDEQRLKQERGDTSAAHLDSTMMRVDNAALRLVRAMLFVKEITFESPIAGTSRFTVDFPKRGPRDRQGRSLRDLDLSQRLFKYPLSYLIYSESFNALPDVVKDRVYRRISDVLTGEDKSPEFAQMSAADRQAILGILQDTKPDFGATVTRSRTAH